MRSTPPPQADNYESCQRVQPMSPAAKRCYIIIVLIVGVIVVGINTLYPPFPSPSENQPAWQY